MKEILHILNGDGTSGGFGESRIKGDLLIWREMLCEGAVDQKETMEAFWSMRETWINSEYEKSEKDFYQKKVLTEIRKLDKCGSYSEIVLWFEFDLFCQVNLIFLLSWLFQKGIYKTSTISLVCPKDHPEVADFRGMGQLSPYQLEVLFPQRVVLSEKEMHIGDKAWKAYSASNPAGLQALLKEDAGKLECLHPAILLHLERLPSLTNGLNLIERTLLSALESQPLNTGDLLRDFWSRQPGYGYGDLQILNALERLRPELVSKNGYFSLTDTGKACLRGVFDFLSIKKPAKAIGGYWLISPFRFRFDTERMEVVEV